MTTRDIVALIDEVTAPACGWCQKPLAADANSPDFCDEAHQGLWQSRGHQPSATFPTVTHRQPFAELSCLLAEPSRAMLAQMRVDIESIAQLIHAFHRLDGTRR